MNAPSRSELLARLQSESSQLQTRLTELVGQGAGLGAAGRNDEAIALYQSALAAIDAFFASAGEIVRPLPDGQDHLKNTRLLLLDDQGRLWDLIGMAHHSAGRASQAKAALAQGLALFETKPSAARASLHASFALVCLGSEEFVEAENAFGESLCEYDRLIASLDPSGQAAEWRLACVSRLRTLSAAAECALSRGQRELCRQRLAEALRLAKEEELADMEPTLWLRLAAHDLQNDPNGEALQRLTDERKRLKTLAQTPGFRLAAASLLADYWLARGVLDKAHDLLAEALVAAEAVPHRLWSIHTSLADVCAQGGDTIGAFQHYEAAVSEARRLQTPEVIASALQNLVSAQLTSADPGQLAKVEAGLNELRQLGQNAPLAAVLQQRVFLRLKARDLDGAWQDLDECEGLARDLDSKLTALFGKVAVRRDQGRLDDSLQLTQTMLDLLPAGQALLESRTRLRTFSTLHENAAFLCARMGRGRDALRWADAGRAVALQENLAVAPCDFDAARAFLAEQTAAAAVLCVMGQRTLLLGVRPDESDPVVEFIDLGEEEVRRLLPTESVSSEWTRRLFAALPALSDRLALPLARLARGCRTLYISPDSRLCFLPFVALKSPDGSCLLDHAAIALAPSIAVLRHCRARALAVPGRDCLAVGVGSAEQFDFADQARAVAALDWPAQRCLLNNQATPARFLEEARKFAVLHLSVHGQVSDGGQLTASKLELAGGRLSAGEVAALDGALPAQMVVLNACVSGRFEAPLAGEVGGFWEGFLRAGAASLVATLVYVHPSDALDLVLAFYRNWLPGHLTKAEALRQAQLELRRRQPEPEHWATHILVGDGA
jgi:tetratricopeptide (TPR) repeat protein